MTTTTEPTTQPTEPTHVDERHELDRQPFNAQPFLLFTAIVTGLALMFSSAYSAYVSAHAHSNSCARFNLVLDGVQNLAFDFIDPPAKPGELITKKKAEQIAAAELDVTNRLDAARCGGSHITTTVTTVTTTGGP